MTEESEDLRKKAEACRLLADLSDDSARKTLWLERADHWEKLAAKKEAPLTGARPDER